MSTIDQLCATGALVLFHGRLDPGELPVRTVYLSPEAYPWCHGSEDLGRPTSNPQSWAALNAVLTDFRAGRPVLEGKEIRAIHRAERIWEFKAGFRPNSVRLFGWFQRRHVFIGCLARPKHDVSPRCRDETAAVIRFRAALDLDEPKIAKGKTYADLVRS